MTSGSDKYGRFYWCVKTSQSQSGEIYVHADAARVQDDGTLVFYQEPDVDRTELINLALASGTWTAVYAASVVDGSAVAVEHWDGEVISAA